MRFIIAGLFLLPLMGAPPSPEQIQQVVQQISDITGLAQKKPVPFRTLTRDQWHAWIEEQVKENVKPEEIRVEELALKRLGLIPPDYDLKKATIDLLSEQAAAVYDPKKKVMMFVEGTGGAPEDMVLVHELEHALADQHFDLRKFLEKGATSDDAQTARMTVVEGQATWVMFEASMVKMGQSLKSNPGVLKAIIPATTQMAEGSYPVFEKAPLYLKEQLLFPYTTGLLFQQWTLEKLGTKAFAEVLRKPPVSTAQVIHPELWLNDEKPQTVKLPSIPEEKTLKSTLDGTLGEFDFRVLFTQYAGKDAAEALAPSWKGGSFGLLEGKSKAEGKTQAGVVVLRWASVWADDASARQCLALYRKVLEGKWKQVSFDSATESELRGTGDSGGFRVWQDGTHVYAIEGLSVARTAGVAAL